MSDYGGDEVPVLNKDELIRLGALLDSFSKPPNIPSKAITSKNSCTLSQKYWLGATDHLTPYLSSYFSSYSTLLSELHIIVAGGPHVLVSGCGNIELQPSLHLNNVLHVPKLSNNLVFIHKHTRDLMCTIFFPSHSVFQCLGMGRWLELLRDREDYIFCMELEVLLDRGYLRLVIGQVLILQPLKYGFNRDVLFILLSVFPGLCFLIYLKRD